VAKRVAVIGAGIGGLAVANLLAKIGYNVTVYEQQMHAGGRIGQLHAKGFSFDTGPSWYLMPEVFEHYFALLGKSPADYFTLHKLSPAYKVFFDYRSPLTISGDIEQDAAAFEHVEPGAGARLVRYVDSAESIYQTSMEKYLYSTASLARTAANPSVMRDVPVLARLLSRSLHAHVARTVHALPLQQILEYPMVFLGASPFTAPSLYHLMSYLDFRQGVYYPMGGMYQIVEAMLSIGANLGVTYRYDSEVTQIVAKAGRAEGITLGSEFQPADIVVSGADLHHTETVLLEAGAQSYPGRYWRNKVAGPSALLIYLGVRGSLPQLEHHNLLFVQAWRQNFEAIFGSKQWPTAASLYISRTSATDKSVAPKGHENIFVLVPTPAGVDEPDDVATAADHYLAQLEQATGIANLRQRIVYQQTRSTRYFSEELHSWQGSSLGMAHLLRQSAFWRPGGHSKRVRNLYYVGAGVQPGIGMPMCLISAELAVKHITDTYTAGPLHSLETLRG